jgi:hypothetical protein
MDFKGKYLKYKLKYTQLKKIQNSYSQSGGVESIYDLTGKRLYCYSDEEGGNPFILSDGDEKGIFAQLDADFIFDNGLISGFKKPDTALAFLGDLLDNSRFSIRLLEKYIRLKTENPARVILIGGNRDFNKIRMGIELFCLDKSKSGLDILPWHGTNNTAELIARLQNPACNLTFRDNRVPEYLKNVKLWDGAIGALERVWNSSFHDRINAFGDCGYTFIVDELNEMFGLPDGSKLKKNDELTAKIICVIQMVMSFNWESHEIPPYLNFFNGLYIKYLEQCHVISIFNIGEKFGILSHSGYPKKLTYPFGYDADNAAMNFQKGSLMSVIPKIESEKVELIRQVQDKKMNMYAYDVDFMINKFVHLTAGTTFENPAGAKASNSPVVWGQLTQTNARTDIKAQYKGGEGFRGWIEKDVVNDNKLYVVDETTDIISYNIFGHAPQFFNPTVFRRTAGNTLHVNLDISKIEANNDNSNSANNYSFAFLYIDGTGTDRILGRIKFPDATAVYPHARDALVNKIKEINGLPKPAADGADAGALAEVSARLNAEKKTFMQSIYKSNAYLDDGAFAFAGKVHYYNIPIDGNIIDVSLGSNIPETSLKVASYPPLDFTKYLYTA